MKFTVIGVDPGPTTGIVELIWDEEVLRPHRIVQCNSIMTVPVLDIMTTDRRTPNVVIAVERFIDGRRAGKGNAPQAAKVTRDGITTIVGIWGSEEPKPTTSVVLRSAANVKPWATDHRLVQAGLWEATKGMSHARDAARHALFGAVKLGAPDPLASKVVNRAV